MNRPSRFYRVLAGLLVYISCVVFTSADPTGIDYICGENVILQQNIQNSYTSACYALVKPEVRSKYPAVYDGSTTFHVFDAVLFAWPLLKNNKVYAKGLPGDLRLIIDSSCNFFGIIIRSKTSPDRRCYPHIELPRENDLFHSRDVRMLPGFRGYKCDKRIYDIIRLEYVLQETLKKYKIWESQNSVSIPKGLTAIDQLFGESVLLLPSQVINSPAEINHLPLYLSLMVIDSQHQLLGMVNRVGTRWEKCAVLWEREPELPRVVDRTRNSIGERLFSGAGGYRCKSLLFTRESVNSHMQVACTLITPPDGIPASNWKINLTSLGIKPIIGKHELWKMNLKLPESNEPVDVINTKISNKAVIVLDQQCNFYGVYWHAFKVLTLCVDLSLFPSPKRPRYKS
ncbi:BgTH12-04577 [Blumeria graminis f. sp. triticale]|uniref:BgTH12-04577 n=1 Tax=Blumeria graminis f. sp. triticale TaxID=1689686 RepID=A0A9W4GBS7_BLUGR|nr:BgTH12-04577 [Blumeria graminis f. sp. triticale]